MKDELAFMGKDERLGTNRIDIWTSDQGFSPQERNICYDFDAVLRAARHYYETGELDPLMEWDQ
jgi:hypothetical protein